MNSNLLYSNFSAVKVGDESFSAAEYGFYYKSAYYGFVNQYGDYIEAIGLDTTKPLSSQPYGEDGQTWADFFKENALTTMKNETMLWAEAQKAGFKLSEADQKALDTNLEGLKTAYTQTDFPSANKYFAANYGKGCTLKVVSKLLERGTIAQAYKAEMQKSFSFTDAELETNYKDNADSYDNFNYISYFVDGSVPEETPEPDAASGTDIPAESPEPSAEPTPKLDSKSAMEAAKKTANTIVDTSKTAQDFTKTVLALTQKDASETTTAGSQLNAEFAKWLQDPARKEGDKTVIEAETGYYALYFISRDDNNTATKNVRHILNFVLPDENKQYTDEAKASVKAKTEAILADWKKGEATEDSFAALANEKSEDAGSNKNGGLYENVAQGQMVKSFDDWCFDESRKPGDTGIVYNEGSYAGYHLIYFVGDGDNVRKVISDNALRGAKYTEWETAALKNYETSTGATASLVS
ncbi:MAG: peptidylprolyl isomerase [Oscillospiraceae bacterium]